MVLNKKLYAIYRNIAATEESCQKFNDF